MTSLGSKLTLWYVLIITGTIAAALLTGRILLQIELIHGIDLLNAAEAQEIHDRAKENGGPDSQAEILKQITTHAKIDAALYFFQLRDSNHRILFRSDNMGKTVLPENPEGRPNWTTTTEQLGSVRLFCSSLGPYQLQIGTSLRVIQRLFTYYHQVSGVLLVVVAFMSLYLGHRMSRLALDPLQRIQEAASRISAQNLKERIPVSKARDEIFRLTTLLNEMFDRLEVAFGRLSRFAGEASHELKTPLSIIRLQTEKLLLQGELSPPQQEAVQQQLSSINGLYLVIEKLLFIARSEAGGIKANTKRQNTAAFVDAFMEDALVLCEDRQVHFELQKNEGLDVEFDAPLIRQVLLNLLSNALKVTPADKTITLFSGGAGYTWKVKMEDSGPGLIKSSHGEEIFKPFVRLSPDLNWSLAGGTGLGLAICRSIVQLHHGSIRVENREPETGLRVIFELPV